MFLRRSCLSTRKLIPVCNNASASATTFSGATNTESLAAPVSSEFKDQPEEAEFDRKRKLQIHANQEKYPLTAPSTTYLAKVMQRRLRDTALEDSLYRNQIVDEEDDSLPVEYLSEMGVFGKQYFDIHKSEFASEFPTVMTRIKEMSTQNDNSSLENKNESTDNSEQRDVGRGRQVRTRNRNRKIRESTLSFDFPFGEKHLVAVKTRPKSTKAVEATKIEDLVKEKSARSKLQRGDRGFHIVSGAEMDEYVEGTALEIPDDPLRGLRDIITPAKDRERLMKLKSKLGFKQFGPADSVENIEFQLPGQKVVPVKHTDELKETPDDWEVRYGHPDASIPVSDKRCDGCGAQYHCQDTALPGFLPADLFIQSEPSGFRGMLCRRCYLLKNHNFLLNVTVSPVDYGEVMGKLKQIDEALILLLVDMLDFPNSIFRQLPSLIGQYKPMIVLGNKVDLLPPSDTPRYIQHFNDCLKKEIEALEFHQKFNILHTQLISAKTGFGIEDLITRIQTKWGVKGNLYLVGCTNTGKSTLFNTLIQSDLCKVTATDLVERATTSIWPGTTLHLLKFPVMNPAPHRLKEREERLKVTTQFKLDDNAHRRMIYRDSKDPKYAMLQGTVGRTFVNEQKKEEKKVHIPVGSMFFLPDTPTETKKKNVWDPNFPDFVRGKWCYDTPGTVNDDQIINVLTMEELVKALPKRMIRARNFVLRPKNVLLIAGLARVHYMQGPRSVHLTVYASMDLPVHVMFEEHVENFMNKYYGTRVLEVPFGSEERLKIFPKLVSRKISVEGKSLSMSMIGSGDIVLSSVGWVTVTGFEGEEYVLEASTPGGRGIKLRTPPLFRDAAVTRGKRVAGTSAYRIKPVVSDNVPKRKFVRNILPSKEF